MFQRERKIFEVILSIGLMIGILGCHPTTGKTDPVLKSITISAEEAKTEFTVGEEFTSEGLKVTAEYYDGTTKEVEGWTVTGFDSSEPAESQVLTVTYTEKLITVKSTYTITIKAAEDQPPEKPSVYSVEHYQQNIADDEYTLVESDTERKSGVVNEDTEASAKTYTGFTAKTFAQLKIAADGTTVVKIYYDRNTYTITYETE